MRPKDPVEALCDHILSSEGGHRHLDEMARKALEHWKTLQTVVRCQMCGAISDVNCEGICKHCCDKVAELLVKYPGGCLR